MSEFQAAQNLREIVFIITNSPKFLNCILVNKAKIEKNIDQMYSKLPVDYITNKLDTNSQVYEYLKEFEIKLNNFVILPPYAILNVKEVQNLIQKLIENIPGY